MLRAILDEDPVHARAVLELSQLYEQTGRDAELAELLKSQMDAAREREDRAGELTLLVRLGEVQERRLGDVSSAQQTYERVLEADARNRAALEAIARMSEKRGDDARAADALGRLFDLSTDATGVPYALRLAEARERLGETGAAEDALRQGLRLEPSNAALRALLRVRWEKGEKWLELAELLVGDADLIAAAHPDDKTKAADEPAPGKGPSAGMKRAPQSGSVAPSASVPSSIADRVRLLRSAADIHLLRRKSPADAIPMLERAAELVPHDRDLLLSLCDAYNSAERGREAAQVLEKVIASFGSRRTKELAVYHHRLALALSQLGDKSVALTQLDLAFKIDPGSVSVLRDLGVLAFETNDLDRAQKTFRALLLQRLDPKAGISKGEVFYYLGEISAKMGDKAKAVQMLERAIENDPALERARLKLTELKG